LRAFAFASSASASSASTRGVEIPSGLGFGLSTRAPGGAPLDLVRFVLYCLPIRIHTFGSFEKLNGSTDQTRARPSRTKRQAQKEKIIADARAEVAQEVAAMKSKMDADVAAAAEKAKAEVDAQIASAMTTLDAAKKDSMSQVDAQASAIADQIIAKVVNV